jgi:hypothetical protein
MNFEKIPKEGKKWEIIFSIDVNVFSKITPATFIFFKFEKCIFTSNFPCVIP